MSWLIELRKHKDDALAFYELLCKNAAHFGVIDRLWQHEVVRAKPEVITVDVIHLTKPFLLRHIKENMPHIWWLREHLTDDKVALIYTSTDDTRASKLLTPDATHYMGGIVLQGFLFTDPGDAVTFKLMWSQYLC